MTCRYCGSDLTPDALYCGECGHAVLVESLVGAGSKAEGAEASEAGDAPDTAGAGDADADPFPLQYGPSASAVSLTLRCPQCDTPIDDADVFCGECGFVLKAVIPGPRDTVAVEPVAIDDDRDPSPEPEPGPERDDEPSDDGQVDAEPESPAARARVIPDPFPWGMGVEDPEDVEATRIVSATGGGDRFVLQFSTGESVTVSGAGLIGRNPAAQPGEYVDQLVSIFDVGKSVSKTHLEFGQEGGRFWVSDRYSTNGSIVREPETEPRRCEPGRRYFVVRGTRIDVGEQFFVVS
jgi:hypothetical protein